MNKLYADLYYYASHMVYYDIPWVYTSTATPPVVPEEAKGNYYTTLYKVGDQKYQVGYASCPGTTGFNIIQLKTPAAGTEVSVNVEALEPGSALVKEIKVKSKMLTERLSKRQRPTMSRLTRLLITAVDMLRL